MGNQEASSDWIIRIYHYGLLNLRPEFQEGISPAKNLEGRGSISGRGSSECKVGKCMDSTDQ